MCSCVSHIKEAHLLHIQEAHLLHRHLCKLKKNSSWRSQKDATQSEAFEEERQKRRLIFFVSGPSYKEMYMSPDHYKEMYMSPDLIQGDVYVS